MTTDKSLFGCAPLTLEYCEARIYPSPTRVPRRSEVTMTSFIATVYVAPSRPPPPGSTQSVPLSTAQMPHTKEDYRLTCR